MKIKSNINLGIRKKGLTGKGKGCIFCELPKGPHCIICGLAKL